MPSIQTTEIGTATPGMGCAQDLVLHMLLDDAQVLAAYQNHPQHVDFDPFIKAVVQEHRCMDFIDE